MRYLISLSSLVLFFSFSIHAEEDAGEIPVFDTTTLGINARLEHLEKTINNQALLDMLDTLESLKLDVRKLSGEVEMQTHRIEKLREKQRDLYTDIDQRLQRMENSQIESKMETTPVDHESSVEMENGQAEPKTGKTNVDNESVLEDVIVKTNPSDLAVENDVATTEPIEKKPDPLMAETEYQRAFKLLKESQYEQALVSFKKFLKNYPDSDFSDNAQYWLGETYYVMQNYKDAINQYQSLLNTYPKSPKSSHALLKIGYSHAELGNVTEARKILNMVKEQYSGTTAARLANERLEKINNNSSNESNM